MAAADLPPQLTSFIGRTNELVEIAALLADPTCRLLTLVGPGGIGKTRLALQTAADAQSHFADGVCFVALQPVSSTAFLVQAFADALHLTFYGPEVPRLQLLRWLRPQKLLIVVDNFEHLLDDVTLVTEIVEAAPGVKLLVTSRERLNVREEWVREIGGMRVPRDDQSGELDSYDAVQLFAARARQARGDFALERERPHVVRICQLVEGLPLAIELAAARIRTLSCAQIAEEIRHSMGFLTTSLRNVPARHRDMYAVFGPCWNRLTQPQRDVFMRLSVFRGGFECEAAEQVAGASPPMLATLTDKSLLRVTQTGRYEMHELVRQYAAARLVETADERERIQDRHCDYYAAFLAQREPDLKGQDMLRALAEIRPEMDNIRVMWRWAVARLKQDDLAKALDSLAFVFQNRYWYQEAVDAFGTAAAALGDTPSELKARLLAWQANSSMVSTEGLKPTVAALALCTLSVNMLLPFGGYRADPTSFYFTLALCPSYWEGTQAFFEGNLAAFRQREDQWGIAATLGALGSVSFAYGQLDQAYAYYHEARQLFRQRGNLWGQSSMLHGLCFTTFEQGRYKETEQYARECLALCETLDDRGGTAMALGRLGWAIVRQQGDYEEARELFERSVAMWDQMAGESGIYYLGGLGVAECLTGQYQRAWCSLGRVLRQTLSRQTPDPRAVGLCLSLLAAVFVADGHTEWAVRILAAVTPTGALSEILFSDNPLGDLEGCLSPEAFAAAKQRGESQSPREIAAEVLDMIEASSKTRQAPGALTRDTAQLFLDPLSQRELEVLHLVADGLSNREIAQELVVTLGTVKKHINNIFGKLQVRSRTQAVARATELNLLP
jgi:predicted ATPase/DNA-binding CsgD family transcriptional regulator